MKQAYKILILVVCIGVAALCNARATVELEQKNVDTDENVYWHGDENRNEIALTFDDGPNEPYTSEILDILKNCNVKATFFVIGKNVKTYPQVAKRIVNEGHAIGNHTYTHPDLLLKMGMFNMRKQLEETDSAILEVTGVRPRLYRPPFGSGGNLEAKNMGYAIIKWSVSAHNGINEIEYDKIAQNVLEGTKNGSIILIHDGKGLNNGVDRSQTVRALPMIIKRLRKEGYKFVTVPALLNFKNGR